jgi:cation diffusion facilitator CzcD-associated flavoprotein CzcO
MNNLSFAQASLTATTLRQCSVAVIGAGAAGLVAARELKREGHHVTVFEQNSRVGGVWVYDDRVEKDDLMGNNMKRRKVHSSMYRHLRTNLPREIMGFSDFPFTPEHLGHRSVDPRRFCSHVEVSLLSIPHKTGFALS